MKELIKTIKALPDDAVANTVKYIVEQMLAIEKSFESIQGKLGYLELVCTDDNAKELCASVKLKIGDLADSYYDSLFESGSDWEDYSLRGAVELLVSGGKETLLIPNLRKHLKEVVLDDFTEDMFQRHLDHFRRQFGLSKDFE